MARTVDITLVSESLQLDAGGAAKQVVFTATYLQSGAFPAQIRVLSERPEAASWIRLEGEKQRTFELNATTQIVALIQAPSAAAGGEYAFRVAVVGIENTDEDYTESPPTRVTVRRVANPTPPRRFGWLVIAALAVLVAIGAVFLIRALIKGEPGLGDDCAGDPCAKGLTCTKGKCLGEAGYSGCATGAQCVTGSCKEGICVQALPVTESRIQTYPGSWNFGNPSGWEPIVGDFNGDGRMDYARLGGFRSHLFFSIEAGTFNALTQDYPDGWNFGVPSTWKTIVGDFNGDGRTDYGRLGGTYSHFFFSNGDGTFSTPIPRYPDGWNFGFDATWPNIVGDFNGDRRTDYARMGDLYAHVFLSNGDGTFAYPVHHYPPGVSFGNPSSWKAIVGDFNADGRSDYARLGATRSHFFFSKGDGDFTPYVQTYPEPANFGFDATWPPIVGDFNGDGRTGYARLGDTSSHFFFSNGDGTFTSYVHEYPAGLRFGNPPQWAAIVGDFNGDHRTDYARLDAQHTNVFLSEGEGRFSGPYQVEPAGWNESFDPAWPALVGDWNKDGRADFLFLGATYSYVYTVR